MKDDVSDYRDLYLKTAHEYLENIDKNLYTIDTSTSSTAPLVEDLHRDAHSLKGMSYAIGYPSIASMARCIELYFLAVMKNERNISSEDITIIKTALQKTKELLAYVQTSQKELDATSEIESLKNQLHIEFPAV
jgi:two-component system chemotaxis sensor kinase CheA